jgi:hypothetical protein
LKTRVTITIPAISPSEKAVACIRNRSMHNDNE